MTGSRSSSILVTGASGFIGSHVCRELLAREYRVFGLVHGDHLGNVKTLVEKGNFRIVRGDIRDTDGLSRILETNRVDAIAHLAARLPHHDDRMNPYPSFETNTRGTLNLLNAAALNRVSRFVFSSSIDVYSEPPEHLPVNEDHPTRPSTDYGIGKLTGELYAGLYSQVMGVTLLRFSIVYGDGGKANGAVNRFIQQARSSQPVTINGDGSQSNDFLCVGDAVQAVYNVGSGEETTVKDLAHTIIELTRSSSRVLFTSETSNRPFRFSLDIGRATEALGFQPAPLKRGLAQYLARSA
jgi:UDP-glucose 4-epimerase